MLIFPFPSLKIEFRSWSTSIFVFFIFLLPHTAFFLSACRPYVACWPFIYCNISICDIMSYNFFCCCFWCCCCCCFQQNVKHSAYSWNKISLRCVVFENSMSPLSLRFHTFCCINYLRYKIKENISKTHAKNNKNNKKNLLKYNKKKKMYAPWLTRHSLSSSKNILTALSSSPSVS